MVSPGFTKKRSPIFTCSISTSVSILFRKTTAVFGANFIRLFRASVVRPFDLASSIFPSVINVRIIAATHQNLEAMVRENRFREDLYHRLNVIRLRLPPLRERPEDIPLLVNHFLQKSAENLGVEPKIMSEEAMEFLKRFPFPGNVRQLENLCNWLVVMAPSQHIRVTDLPEEIRRGEAEKIHKNSEVSSEETLGGSWEELLKAEVKEMLKSQSPDLMKQLSDTFESIVIGTALEYTHGRRVDAATRLGVGRNTITRKIAELKLESED